MTCGYGTTNAIHALCGHYLQIHCHAPSCKWLVCVSCRMAWDGRRGSGPFRGFTHHCPVNGR